MKNIWLLLVMIGLAFGSYTANVFEAHTTSLSGDVITIDASEDNFFDIYLDRPVTRINLPTAINSGENIRFQIRQDMTGGRHIIWGNFDEFTGLTCDLWQGMGGINIEITSGAFDWSVLRNAPGRKSFINLSGFSDNINNIQGLKITDFSEVGGYIICDPPLWGITNAVESNITIGVENAFYFFDEKGDQWISQMPFGVTLFEGFSTSNGESMAMQKLGVFSNRLHQVARIRFEEQLTDDFINGSDDGLLNWREANSTGCTTATASADVDANHPGQLYQRIPAGHAENGRTGTTMGSDAFNLSGVRVGISGIVKANENAFESIGVDYYFGWTDNTQWTSTLDGFYFKVVSDGSTDGQGRVWCIGEIGNVVTAYDTGIDFNEDEWHILHIGKPANGGDIHFTVDDYTVHEMAQSAIGVSAKLTCGFGSYFDYDATPLPAHVEWFIDAFSLKYRMNAGRI